MGTVDDSGHPRPEIRQTWAPLPSFPPGDGGPKKTKEGGVNSAAVPARYDLRRLLSGGGVVGVRRRIRRTGPAPPEQPRQRETYVMFTAGGSNSRCLVRTRYTYIHILYSAHAIMFNVYIPGGGGGVLCGVDWWVVLLCDFDWVG